MQDTRLRQKLFGQFSEDCLNLFSWDIYSDATRGFVGQTVDRVNKNRDLIEEMQRQVHSLECDKIYLMNAVHELQSKVEQLTKKTSKKRK